MFDIANSYSSIIPDSLVSEIRSQARQAASEGELTTRQLEIIYAHQWFNMFVPKAYGGLEMNLPEAVRLEEALAYTDGSFGWTVTLCAGANMFSGFLDKSVAHAVFADPKVCLGGSGQPNGIALESEDGYILSGQWSYATGTPHLSHFTANAVIHRYGQVVLQPDGSPLVKSFFIPKEDVVVHDDWDTFGLVATASHSFSVSDLWLPTGNSFVIAVASATHPSPLFQYPFLQFAEVTLAANHLGMAMHFTEVAAGIMESSKDAAHKVSLLSEQLASLRIRREAFYQVLEDSWGQMSATGAVSAAMLSSLSRVSRDLVFAARNAVVTLYPLTGIVGATRTADLHHIWCDIFTASQHSLFR